MRVTLYVPGHDPGVVRSLKLKVKVLPQASVAVAVTKEGTDGQLMIAGAGRAAITGAVIS